MTRACPSCGGTKRTLVFAGLWECTEDLGLVATPYTPGQPYLGALTNSPCRTRYMDDPDSPLPRCSRCNRLADTMCAACGAMNCSAHTAFSHYGPHCIRCHVRVAKLEESHAQTQDRSSVLAYAKALKQVSAQDDPHSWLCRLARVAHSRQSQFITPLELPGRFRGEPWYLDGKPNRLFTEWPDPPTDSSLFAWFLGKNPQEGEIITRSKGGIFARKPLRIWAFDSQRSFRRWDRHAETAGPSVYRTYLQLWLAEDGSIRYRGADSRVVTPPPRDSNLDDDTGPQTHVLSSSGLARMAAILQLPPLPPEPRVKDIRDLRAWMNGDA